MDQQQGLGQSPQVDSGEKQIIVNAYKSKLDLDPNMENALSPTTRPTISPPRDLLNKLSARPQLEPSIGSIHESSASLIHESSVSLIQESNNVSTSGSMQKSLLDKKTIIKTDKQFEELENEQMKSKVDAILQLYDRLNKLKKNEERLKKTAVKTLQEIDKKLKAANMELPGFDAIKKKFNID